LARLLRFLILGWPTCVRLVTTASTQPIHDCIHVSVTSRGFEDLRVSEISESTCKAHGVKM
jgi:hypothetical protein